MFEFHIITEQQVGEIGQEMLILLTQIFPEISVYNTQNLQRIFWIGNDPNPPFRFFPEIDFAKDKCP